MWVLWGFALSSIMWSGLQHEVRAYRLPEQLHTDYKDLILIMLCDDSIHVEDVQWCKTGQYYAAQKRIPLPPKSVDFFGVGGMIVIASSTFSADEDLTRITLCAESWFIVEKNSPQFLLYSRLIFRFQKHPGSVVGCKETYTSGRRALGIKSLKLRSDYSGVLYARTSCLCMIMCSYTKIALLVIFLGKKTFSDESAFDVSWPQFDWICYGWSKMKHWAALPLSQDRIPRR